MSRSQLRRLTSVVTAAFLGLMLLGTGVVSANPPGWTGDVKYIPGDATVAPGAIVAYKVSITNSGKSQISALNMDTDTGLVPKYVGPITYDHQTGSGSCSAANAGPLLCNFGNLVAGGIVHVTVAFQTPTTGTGCTPASATKYCFNFRAFGNGNTPSDGGTSHGDYLPIPTLVNLNGSSDFAGGFQLGNGLLQNNQTLGRNNPQATGATPPSGFANDALTVQDGSGAALACTTPSTGTPFGQCSKVNVGEGANYDPALIKITILIYGGAVPGGVSAADIHVIHTRDDGTNETLATCTFTNSTDTVPNNAPCAKVTKVGSNYKIEIWTPQNGGYRGTF